MLLPPTLPWWIVIIGTFLMVLLGKEVYGGYGANPFNGALISWVILKISFPDFMGKWINPIKGLTTDLTPIEVFKTQGIEYVHHYFSYKNMFLGFRSGFMGQVSVICLLIGGIYLLARKRINWRIPVAYLVGVFFVFLYFFGGLAPLLLVTQFFTYSQVEHLSLRFFWQLICLPLLFLPKGCYYLDFSVES